MKVYFVIVSLIFYKNYFYFKLEIFFRKNINFSLQFKLGFFVWFLLLKGWVLFDQQNLLQTYLAIQFFQAELTFTGPLGLIILSFNKNEPQRRMGSSEFSHRNSPHVTGIHNFIFRNISWVAFTSIRSRLRILKTSLNRILFWIILNNLCTNKINCYFHNDKTQILEISYIKK